MDHFANLKKALKITWENKFLWIFGFIIVFFGQSPSFTNSFNYNSDSDPEAFKKTLDNILYWWNSIDYTIQLGLIIGTSIFFIVISILIMYLTARSEAALIAAAQELDEGKHLGFRKSWEMGGKKTWTLILQRFLLNLPVMIIGMIAGGISLAVVINLYQSSSMANAIAGSMPIYTVLLILGCFIGLLVFVYAIITGVIYSFSSRSSVLSDKGIIEGIKTGFQFLKTNLSEVVMAWLVNLIVMIPASLVIGVISFLVLMIILIPIIVASIILFLTNLFLFFALILLIALIAQIGSSILGGFFSAFNSTYWTLVYSKLAK